MPPHNSKDAKCTQRTKYMSAPQAVVVQLATLGKLRTCVPYIPFINYHCIFFADFNLESIARHKQIAKVAKVANWLLGSTTWGADKLTVPICTCGHRDLPNAWHLHLTRISSCFPSPNHRVSLKSCRSCCSCAIQHKQKDHGTGHHKLIAIRCNPGKQTHKPTRRRRVRHCERTERTSNHCNKEIQKIIPIETSSHRHVLFSNRDTKGCSFGAWNHPGRSWS